MGLKTEIQWCDSTTNPTAGCEGCELWRPRAEENRANRSARGGSCYAGNMHTRFQGANPAYALPFEIPVVKPGRMEVAGKWSDLTGIERPGKPWLDGLPRLIFISDMSDALSAEIPFEYLRDEIIEQVRVWPHIGLWLTKQSRRLKEFSHWLDQQGKTWPENLVPMVSVTMPKFERRVLDLSAVEAPWRGVSAEPLLGDVAWERCMTNLDNRRCVDWMIMGGESSQPHQTVRPCTVDHIERGIETCRRFDVVPFVNQLGPYPVRREFTPDDEGVAQCTGSEPLKMNDSHGGDWSCWPESLKVREVPQFQVAQRA